MTLLTLSSLRSLGTCHKTPKELDILDPLLPQQRKMLKRYEIGNAQPEFTDIPDHYFRYIYFEELVFQRGLVSQGLLYIVMFKICFQRQFIPV